MHTKRSILEASFIHVPRIGHSTEQKLWKAGAHNWQVYMSNDDWPISIAQKQLLDVHIPESVSRLQLKDWAWFAKTLPQSEHWRAVHTFSSQLLYLDIETNGEQERDSITVIGAFDGTEMKQFVRGVNLEEFETSLSNTAILVTFFGSGFDIPMIRRAFPQLQLPQMHIDLCFMLKRLGYKGGLKSIERQLGLSRSGETNGLNGMDAVRLWDEYQTYGSKRALDTLLAYNREDVINMAVLLEKGYRLMEKTLDRDF